MKKKKTTLKRDEDGAKAGKENIEFMQTCRMQTMKNNMC